LATAAALTALSRGGAIIPAAMFGKEKVKIWTGTMQMSDHYDLGGELLNPGNDFFRIIKMVFIAPQGGYTFQYIPSTGKIKAWSAVGTEVVHTTDLKALTAIPVVFVGI
jgi:hypothetical protein